jgi:TusA-related sulfurtransferase
MHLHGKIISVWIDCEVTSETVETFCRVFDLGVDAYCTDYPLKVAYAWENYRGLLEKVSNDEEKE